MNRAPESENNMPPISSLKSDHSFDRILSAKYVNIPAKLGTSNMYAFTAISSPKKGVRNEMMITLGISV
jgi:hypothetical protein